MKRRTGIKHLLCCVTFAIAWTGVNARTLQIGHLAESLYLDTVVSTNVEVNRSRADVRGLNVQLCFCGSVSNAVEVAFGRDEDHDGDLSVDEMDVVLGWRGGFYSLEDVSGDCRILEPATNGLTSARFLHLSIGLNGQRLVRKFAVSSDEGPRFNQYETETPAWAYCADWDLFKVIKRGSVALDEVCVVDISYGNFTIRVR